MMQPPESAAPDPTQQPDTSAARPYILVVDDEPDIRQLLREILEDEGYTVAVAENGEAARQQHRQRRPDLILLDIWMPDIDGITLLKEWKDDNQLGTPVIMMSGHGTVETAVEATRLGAYDFIEKPISLAKLLLTIEHALETDKLQRENQGLRRHSLLVHEPIGKSAAMQTLRDQLRRIAEHDSWVLMSGEPGCGIHIAARYLHDASNRRDRPFIDVNVAGLNPDNAAHELFGSEKNGLVHYGLLEQASGGTLMLYDIAEMDSATQAKLYSALDAQSFYRTGGTQPIELHARIIAATHYDLEQRVADGLFRKDMFYLLNVVPVRIPALREHREDVPDLLNFFTNQLVDLEKLPYRKFTMAAQNRLRNYDWPGNLRELTNLIQRLLIVGSGHEIDVDEIDATLGEGDTTTNKREVEVNYDLPLREAREQFERDYLEYQLRKAHGSVGKVARAVGLERTHLYRKLRALGIDPKNITHDG
ncbi:sigma-54-dependent transcriptional regulator [Thiohalophilus sp.]|uniref:sigma-54-dependent transcriptional regulator n=1 Tax=Thiohalophilus sp. TaxID=3028392 RepID=UPI003A0FC4B4